MKEKKWEHENRPLDFTDGSVRSRRPPQEGPISQCRDPEVEDAIRKGSREPATWGREMCRYTCVYDREWQGKHYSIKQVAPIIKEEPEEIVVITVYTFTFERDRI